MKSCRLLPFPVVRLLALALAVSYAPNLVRGEDPLTPIKKPTQKPLIDFESTTTRDAPPSSGSARLRMFGMPTGYLRDPLGVIDDDPVPSSELAAGKNLDDEMPGFLVAMGNFNPFFDMRRPDDPRGLGYYKFHSQMQILDLGRTYVSLTLQALTPAGLETGGVANGPTTLSPALALFYDLGAGRALQGYIGQDIPATSRWNESLGTRVHYGMGLQHPVPGLCNNGEQGLFFFVQAMGRYRYDDSLDSRTSANRAAAVWEVIPGLQWRVSDNCWLSVGASRYSLFTWFWQF